MKVIGGILPGAFNDRWIMPSDVKNFGAAYCSDPDAILQPEDGTTSSLDTTPRPPALACKDYAQWVKDNTNTPCVGTSTATACYFPN